jgi:two-component system NtrC family sensor kinase
VSRLQILHQVGTAVNASLNASATMLRALEIVAGAVHADRAGMWSTGPEDSVELVAAWKGNPSEPLGVNGRLLQLLEQEGNQLSRWQALPLMSPGTEVDPEAGVVVPLRTQGRTVGGVALSWPEKHAVDESESDLLSAAASQIASAADNCRLHDELKQSLNRLSETQARLIQSEKLSAVGQLIAGVAHELNNPLTTLIGFAEYLARGELPEEVRQIATRMSNQSKRCARIVDNLLAFARRYQPELAPTNLNALVRECLELYAYQLRVNDIDTSLELQPDLPLTHADPHRLIQVLVNLVTNAFQAMVGAGKGGVLTIRTRYNEGWLVLEVEDTGPGIPPDHLHRLFDPFFTTKEVGQGTGLGLSICYGIVQEHQGEIHAENTGTGACLRVELPLRSERVGGEEPPANILEPAAPGRILVVDDEEAIVELLTQVLSARGHEVHCAQNGAEAVAKLGEGSYDLILSDIRMPGTDGVALHAYLAQQRPDLIPKSVFMTGDTLGDGTREFLEAARPPLLHKPFGIDDIEAVVHTALARQVPGNHEA